METPDIELFKKLVKQDDFLFDFVKNNVAKRIQQACNKDNYLNLLEFTDYYSHSYAGVITEVLHHFGGLDILPEIKSLFCNGTNDNKAYALKFFSYLPQEYLEEHIHKIREYAKSEFEPLSTNAIELLSKIKDNVSKQEALDKLKSNDEFEQYDAVKFLVTYGAQDAVGEIINVMKKSSLAENIASEILYLISIDEFIKTNPEDAILILCNVISAIPEIVSPSIVLEYNFFELFDEMYNNNLTSVSALLLRISKDKFESLVENEEYLFDCDKNTKDEIQALNKLLSGINVNKLNSLLYEELYDESDFVFFAIEYADSIEELETLLDSSNQTLVLKTLTLLKEKQALNTEHKELALKKITSNEIKQIVEAL